MKMFARERCLKRTVWKTTAHWSDPLFRWLIQLQRTSSKVVTITSYGNSYNTPRTQQGTERIPARTELIATLTSSQVEVFARGGRDRHKIHGEDLRNGLTN
jgi:hypothetical protein